MYKLQIILNSITKWSKPNISLAEYKRSHLFSGYFEFLVQMRQYTAKYEKRLVINVIQGDASENG